MSLLFSLGAIASSGVSSKPGMVLLKPTSIAHSGTSASIGANGQVTFTAVTSLSLNGVFSATYDNYVVSGWGSASGDDLAISFRLRASGTDNNTANSYVTQILNASSTTVDSTRLTQTEGWGPNIDDEQRSGFSWSLYGPFLAQPTAWRNLSVTGRIGATIREYAGTHNQSASYDGLTAFSGSAITFTGKLAVYGIRS